MPQAWYLSTYINISPFLSEGVFLALEKNSIIDFGSEHFGKELDIIKVIQFFIVNKTYLLIGFLIGILVGLIYVVYVMTSSSFLIAVTTVPVQQKSFHYEEASGAPNDLDAFLFSNFREEVALILQELSKSLTPYSLNGVPPSVEFVKTSLGHSIVVKFSNHKTTINPEIIIESINQILIQHNRNTLVSANLDPDLINSNNFLLSKGDKQKKIAQTKIKINSLLISLQKKLNNRQKSYLKNKAYYAYPIEGITNQAQDFIVKNYFYYCMAELQLRNEISFKEAEKYISEFIDLNNQIQKLELSASVETTTRNKIFPILEKNGEAKYEFIKKSNYKNVLLFVLGSTTLGIILGVFIALVIFFYKKARNQLIIEKSKIEFS